MYESADPLSEVLEALRVNAVIFCKLTGGAGWGLAVPELDAVSVHLMVSGRCEVVADGLRLQLGAGDIG
ncbi:MAG: cupin domain-containing protein, partial [Myxococcota bacterium]